MNENQLHFFNLHFQRLITEVKHQAFATDVFVDGLQYLETEIRKVKEKAVADYDMRKQVSSYSMTAASGQIKVAEMTCPKCQGKGGVWFGEGITSHWQKCSKCRGKGKVV